MAGQCASIASRRPASTPFSLKRHKLSLNRLFARACTHRRAHTRMLGLPMGRAVPQRSLPPCGGGTGRGVQQATARVSDPRLNHRTLDSRTCTGSASHRVLCRHPSPCPSPTWGEGTVWHAPSQLTTSAIRDVRMPRSEVATSSWPSSRPWIPAFAGRGDWFNGGANVNSSRSSLTESEALRVPAESGGVAGARARTQGR